MVLSRIPVNFVVLAFLLISAIPAAGHAQDCRIRGIDRGASIDQIRLRAEANFKCLEIHVDALRATQRELRAEIEALKAGAAPARSVTAFRDTDGTRDDGGRFIGPATFILSGDRLGKPASRELDASQVAALCGDEDGCLVTLGVDRVVIDGEQIQTRFSRGPCSFHIDAETGTWGLSGPCAAGHLPAGGIEPEQASQGVTWGRDGDTVPLGNGRRDGRVVFALANACLVAESPPQRPSLTRTEARLQRDARRDLYLIAAGTEWAPTGNFPSEALTPGRTDPPFRCRLTLRD